MAWANEAAAQQCKKKVTPRVESSVPKGKMPPRWLLNKVTPAQYDTLVALNRLCTVDYSMLKGYKVTPQMGAMTDGAGVRALARVLTTAGGSCLMSRGLVSFVTSARINRHECSYHTLRASRVHLRGGRVHPSLGIGNDQPDEDDDICKVSG